MKPSFMLFVDDERWWAVRVLGDESQSRQGTFDEDGFAPAVKAAMGELNYAGEGICLALPSQSILSAQINGDTLPRKQRRNAMLFRLEEHLPVDIETLTADFLPPVGGRILGIATETVRIKEWLEQLEVAGITTAAICPAALLSLWEVCQKAAEVQYVLIADSGQVDVFPIHKRQPAAWYTVSQQPEQLLGCIQADQLAHPSEAENPKVCIVSESDQLATILESTLGMQVTRVVNEPAIMVAARTARTVLAGGAVGWVNLRRDALAPANPWGQLRGLVRVTVALAVMFLVTMTLGMFFRAARYESLAERYGAEQVQVYRRLYPATKTPLMVRLRLSSELKRLGGTSGAAEQVPAQAEALDLLRRVAVNLPAAVRLRLLEIRVGPDGIFLEGQTRSHSDAEAIERGLNRGGFEMGAPRTERLVPAGVAFTLFGKLGTASPDDDSANIKP